jgi:hypothetical protein
MSASHANNGLKDQARSSESDAGVETLEWEASAEKYIKNCHKFEVKVDSSIVIALRTGWSMLQPTKSFREGAMLPLLGVLEENKHIKTLKLASAAMHDSR